MRRGWIKCHFKGSRGDAVVRVVRKEANCIMSWRVNVHGYVDGGRQRCWDALPGHRFESRVVVDFVKTEWVVADVVRILCNDTMMRLVDAHLRAKGALALWLESGGRGW